MPELKKIRVRQAKARDVGLFRKLFREYLTEQREQGSVVTVSDKNLDFFSTVFQAYTDEDSPLSGVVLFVGEIALFVAGDLSSPVETIIGGKPANLVGLYVVPDQRGKKIGAQLYSEGMKRLKELGFDSVFSKSLSGNAGKKLTVAKERIVYAKLSDLPEEEPVSEEQE